MQIAAPFSTRLSPEIAEQLEEYARLHGMTKRAVLELALTNLFGREG